MNYIGSKATLIPFLEKVITSYHPGAPGRFCDAFAGTGAVGAHFKKLGWQVTASDIMEFARVRNAALLLVNEPLPFDGLRGEIPEINSTPVEGRLTVVCSFLNRLPGERGFVSREYGEGGSGDRLYFSRENAERTDAIRGRIALWEQKGAITTVERDALVAALVEAIDAVANTASVYGAFLKKIKASAAKPMQVVPLEFIPSTLEHTVLRADANKVAHETVCDVLYLDPPYNNRQYAPNYHVIETIALGDEPWVYGKTGLRDWSAEKSAYAAKREVEAAFSDLVAGAKAKMIALSYNNEGLLSPDQIRTEFEKRGTYSVDTLEYPRFRADRNSEARRYAADTVTEYLHICTVAR